MTWKHWWQCVVILQVGMVAVGVITQWPTHLERPLGPVIVLALAGVLFLQAVLPVGRNR